MATASTPVKPQVKALSCPNCGGVVTLRGYGQALTVVCEQCLSVLDARDPGLKVLQTFQSKQRYQPLIPLGTRGKLNNTAWEVIGFQVRETKTEEEAWHWEEYLLFNPYQGFRYLTQYQGHWNDIRTLAALPKPGTLNNRFGVRYNGQTYAHFQGYNASTVFVIGEFPWQLHVGEVAICNDFISTPRMLSSEKTSDEIVWSFGEYTSGTAIWQAFQLPGQPPPPVGVYANQPSPMGGVIRRAWFTWLVLTMGLILLAMITAALSAKTEVFSERYSFASTAVGEHSFVTPAFELKGRASTVEIRIDTDLNNDWAYFNLALIDRDNGHAYDFGREVSFYSGRDSDGNWSEGDRRDSVKIPSVPAGAYYLRVEPEMGPANDSFSLHTMNYGIRVIRDVPSYSYFWIGFFILLIPPVWQTMRSVGFEKRRWDESDHPMVTSSS